ncbi:helix-turn-helix domain-containing protein [Acuticoccus sediminis]|nr:helix-turn-helix domain-containing protein [Acuticoccus sediminis]
MATRRPTPQQRTLPSAFLKAWLDHLGVKQNQLARSIGVTNPTVSKYVSGKSGIDMGTAIAIAEALGISDTALFSMPPKEDGRKAQPPKPTPAQIALQELERLDPERQKRAVKTFIAIMRAEAADDET